MVTTLHVTTTLTGSFSGCTYFILHVSAVFSPVARFYHCIITLHHHYITYFITSFRNQELVAALHGLILLYEKQFQIAALQTTESERMSSNLSTSVTPTGWINVSIEPPEDETSFEGKSPSSSSSSQTSSRPFETSGSTTRPSHPKNSLTNGSLDHPDPHTPVTSSTAATYGSVSSYASTVGENRFLDSLPPKKSSSLGSGGPKKTVFSHIWKGVVFLASDPSQEVADVAQYVVRSVHDKV